MVGFIISVNVTFIPFAMAAADWYASVILEDIRYLIIAGPVPGLILRTSTRFPGRHVVPGLEWLDAGALSQRLHVALRESAAGLRYSAVRLHQKQRRHGANAKSVAGRIAFFRVVKQSWKRHAKALIEIPRGFRVILG